MTKQNPHHTAPPPTLSFKPLNILKHRLKNTHTHTQIISFFLVCLTSEKNKDGGGISQSNEQRKSVWVDVAFGFCSSIAWSDGTAQAPGETHLHPPGQRKGPSTHLPSASLAGSLSHLCQCHPLHASLLFCSFTTCQSICMPSMNPHATICLHAYLSAGYIFLICWTRSELSIWEGLMRRANSQISMPEEKSHSVITRKGWIGFLNLRAEK